MAQIPQRKNRRIVMTQEDKKLLLIDLCARLLYGPIIRVSDWTPLDTELKVGHISRLMNEDLKIKPYLRPLSSMTEEEKEDLKSKCIHTETEEDWEGVRCDVWGIQILDKYDTERWDNPIWASTINMDAIDWLNAHHFDYRGLIEKGLAIKVTKDNNPYKD